MMAVPPGGAAPPPDAGMQQMVDQQMMQQMVNTAVQNALGGGGEGGVAAGPKKGNKMEDAMAMLKGDIMETIKEQNKILIATLQQAGIEIPLSAMYGLDKADGTGATATNMTGSPTGDAGGASLSETLKPGMGGATSGVQPGKVASMSDTDTQLAMLTKLAHARDSLNRTALGNKLNRAFNPEAVDLKLLQGLWS
jgi:hypothetical protein